ncbi:MAG: hypothetical protein ACYDCC_09815 [Actinomycetota bacterium]
MTRRRTRRKKLPKSPNNSAIDEGLTSPDWVEWDDQLIFAVDFTPGGAPIGLDYDALEELDRLSDHQPPKA